MFFSDIDININLTDIILIILFFKIEINNKYVIFNKNGIFNKLILYCN